MALQLLGALRLGRQLAIGALLALNLYNELNEALDNNQNGEAIAEPPPFLGGQCEGGYYIEAVAIYPSGNISYGYFNGQVFFNRLTESQQRTTNQFLQKIQNVTTFTQSNGTGIRVNGVTICLFGLEEFTKQPISVTLGRLLPVNFPSDQCGNIPTPTVGDPNNGLFNNNNNNGTFTAIAGGAAAAAAIAAAAAATAAAKSATAAAAAASTAAIAAGKAAAAAIGGATTIGTLGGAIGSAIELALDAIEALDILNRALEDEKQKEKEEQDLKDALPDLFSRNFGTRKGDGYVTLYNSDDDGFIAIQLNTILRSVPIGFGRFFGKKSPNRFIYDKLGYIAFVSASLGVMQVTEIQFPRHTISIPNGAVGYFFHFGLSEVVSVEIEGIYEKQAE